MEGAFRISATGDALPAKEVGIFCFWRGGGSGAIDLTFLPDGNVSVKTADGADHVVNLEGNLKETSQKAHQIMESVKVAFSQNTSSANKGLGHLHIVPGGRSTLCV